VAAQPAQLGGHGVFWAGQDSYPRIAETAPQTRVEGVLVSGARAAERLDFYEGGYGYTRRDVTVETEHGPVEATLYWSGSDAPAAGAPFELAEWVARYGQATLYAAGETMSLFGKIDAATLKWRRPVIAMRAHSRLAAETGPRPEPLSPVPNGASELVELRRPYAHFFSVLEADLRHPQFGGGFGAVVNRAGLVAADAVVVLPYDPHRDRVHLIEQYRIGPYFRGDPQPFLIETVAGRIDPGETPEASARREALEEAGLTLGDLHEVSRNYPSPGTLTEYLHIFVGLADLPDWLGGIGGVADEDEDIRSTVLSYAEFEARLDGFGFNVGPLIIAGHWLARNRARLRAEA